MKKTISIILLILFISGLEWNSVWYNVIKQKMWAEFNERRSEGFNKDDIVIIKIPVGSNSPFHWTEEGREFIYKNEMYDVVTTKTVGSANYFYCVKDAKEKKILSDLNDQNKEKNKTDKKDKRTGIDNFVLFTSLPYIRSSENVSFSDLVLHYISLTPTIYTPPPEA